MLGIIGAMKIEIDGIKNLMSEKEELSFGSYLLTCGKLYGKDVVACECGIGKVNSSTATMLMKAKFDVDTVINLGVAGGYKTLKQGDTVISAKTVEHDYNATPDGLVEGQVHGFDSPYLDCDNDMVEKFSAIAKERGYSFATGVVVSGDQFIASNEKSEYLTKTFGALAYDMESGAINHVCKLLGIKFIAIRSISDNGNDEAVDSFYTFVEKASKKSIDLVCSYVKSI